MKIEKVGDIAQASGIKVMLHGPSGSGKTFSICTIPNPEKVLILSAEAGLLSLKESAPDIDAVVINNVTELREAYDMLEADTEGKYETIVLDSLSEIAQQVLSSEMDKTKDGRKAYGETNNIVMNLIKPFCSCN